MLKYKEGTNTKAISTQFLAELKPFDFQGKHIWINNEVNQSKFNEQMYEQCCKHQSEQHGVSKSESLINKYNLIFFTVEIFNKILADETALIKYL